ncbi:MAG: tRNA (adenosine(37)-N6)-threonylcarbamoyltransferase complex dimerization subunit type 1 TsaB [Bacteroidota bacterium]|nr:tRNA (adenosine(37)-N6)-threonylcarbamoyltransferase complex dimerization subunit type 1 TsaB [Bacteroidota bacterium]MDP4251552.1 tRNA (adenosine(37)-N6)-threonylcarbamoyltransferase complex dimerization subunit type 1 TsaB [Bacteroidota bacterium]
MLLLIDTATEQASVALSEGGAVLFTEESPLPREHASWLQPAIQRMMGSAKIPMNRLQAVAVSAGPGSYTGLRVGMAAAKGICYALKIPLITVGTLRLMAEAMIPAAKENGALICAMIDARRQEVFTALYSADMDEMLPPQALILDKTSFDKYLTGNRIIFSGSGSEKWKLITPSKQALFISQLNVIEPFAKISDRYFAEKKWADTTYSEPIYLKEFYTHAKK